MPRTRRVKSANGAGSVTFNATTNRWMARFTTRDPDTGKSVRKTVYGKTEGEARRKLVSEMAAAQEGRASFKGRQPTLAQWTETYLSNLHLRPGTMINYRHHLGLANEVLGHLRLGDVEVHNVEAMMKALQQTGRSNAFVNNVRGTLRACLGEAMRRYPALQRNTAGLTRPLPEPEHEAAALTADQVPVLLRAAESHRDGALWITALATGMRQGELLGLTWDALDLENRTVSVRQELQRNEGQWMILPPKTKLSRRTLPLANVAVEALRRQRARQAQERLEHKGDWPMGLGDLVFREPDGAGMVGTTTTHRFQVAITQAGLPHMHFHDLRASCATFLALAGVPVATAMAILGHSRASTTLEIYTRVRPELAREAAAAMDRVMAQ